MKTEKLEHIKILLLQGAKLMDITRDLNTCSNTIHKVIKDNGLEAFRKQVTRDFKVKNATKQHTKAMQHKIEQGLKRLNRETLGNQVDKQKRLDEKVQALNYKNCSDYISQHGAMSFRNNILRK